MQCLQSCRTCSPSNNASFQHKPRNYREDVGNHRNPQLAICSRRQPTVLFASSKAFSATSIYRTVGLRQPPAEKVTWRRRRLIRTITRSNHCPNTSRTAITKRLAHQNRATELLRYHQNARRYCFTDALGELAHGQIRWLANLILPVIYLSCSAGISSKPDTKSTTLMDAIASASCKAANGATIRRDNRFTKCVRRDHVGVIIYAGVAGEGRAGESRAGASAGGDESRREGGR
jgi:hypothetical protein